MDAWNALKLVLRVEPGTQDAVTELTQLKRGWKTTAFWITLTGSLLSIAAALKGVIPADVALAANTVLIVVYNLLRGVKKSACPGVHPLWQSTECWLGVVGNICNSLMALRPNGPSAQHLAVASAVISVGMAVARDLANVQPGAQPQSDRDEKDAEPPQKKAA